MPTSNKETTKRQAPKATSKAAKTSSKSHQAGHPTWIDMIKECIVAHPDEARTGVSRPNIKKFVESRYHIAFNAVAASQLNRAITTGSAKGTFLLPKGPSGKVKLAPKTRIEATKENTGPAVKKPVPAKAPAAKVTTVSAKPAAAKKATTKATTSKHAGKPKASTSATKPSAESKKPAAAGKKTMTPVKKAIGTKKVSSTGKKATMARKVPVKRAITGHAKKPATKPKPRTAATKSKAASTTSKTKTTAKPRAAASKAKSTSARTKKAAAT